MRELREIILGEVFYTQKIFLHYNFKRIPVFCFCSCSVTKIYFLIISHEIKKNMNIQIEISDSRFAQSINPVTSD